jgi:hypothetical protein
MTFANRALRTCRTTILPTLIAIAGGCSVLAGVFLSGGGLTVSLHHYAGEVSPRVLISSEEVLCGLLMILSGVFWLTGSRLWFRGRYGLSAFLIVSGLAAVFLMNTVAMLAPTVLP